MIPLRGSEIAAATMGELVLPGGAGDPVVDGSVQTDSRLVAAGSIFFALRGETTDGHLFAADAVAAGAALVVAERVLDVAVPQVIVADGVDALAALAREVVARVRSRGLLRVIAVTGSNGKTTTKNLMRAIFTAEGPTVAPEGSFNNHVGAPISMLRIEDDTRFLVVEMGASGVGHIARLVSIVSPDVAIELKVGLAHAGEFGGIEGTFRAKAEMVTDLPPTAVALLNTDDERVERMSGLTPARIVRFGLSDRADIRAVGVDTTATGTSFTVVADGVEHPVRLRILGEHHVYNALASLAAARELGVAMERAIAAIEAVPRAERWRMEVLDRSDGVTIVNDAYNASPDSMSAALKTLAQLGRTGHRTIAVLGEMAELGEFADEEHDRIGRLIVRLDIDRLIVVGPAARHIHNAASLEGSWDGESMLVDDAESAEAVLVDLIEPGDVVLVKSSKSAGLRFLGDRLAGRGEEGPG